MKNGRISSVNALQACGRCDAMQCILKQSMLHCTMLMQQYACVHMQAA